MRTYAYRAVFEPGDEGGVVVTFPDVPEAISQGVDEAMAAEMGGKALGLALLTYLKLGRELPEPRAQEGRWISLEAETAAKVALIEAFNASGISKLEFGRRLGKDEKEVRRLLDPKHSSRLGSLAAALAALGRCLVVGVQEAA